MAAMVGERRAELEKQIQQARHDYYNGTPSVTDEVYDAWVDELAELDPSSPAVTAIGAPVAATEWKKAAHGFTMGSLDKVNTLEELTAWVKSIPPEGATFVPLIVTEKLDGISIHVRYVNGAFSQAITRGDGTVGEDISQNVARMAGIPAKLPERFTGSLRGEIVLTKSKHKEHFPDYANARNAAAGISKRYDGKGSEHLTVLFYSVADGKDFETEGKMFEWLEAMQLQVPSWYVTAMAPGLRTPHDLWVEYQQTKRVELDYDIDGLVVRVDSLPKQIGLGEKDGRPKGAVAFKFAPMTRETVLRRIDWQVGATGRVTPVAVFDPVSLLGAQVTQASVYNVKYIRDLGLTIGARIVVARANDVIPRVVAVSAKSSQPLAVPPACPVCGYALAMSGEYLVCENQATCAAQALGRIKRYIQALDVKEWGETLLERLVAAEKVKTPADLYRLTVESLSEVERISEHVADKLLGLLRAKAELPLEVLLGALSIPLCATSTLTMVMDAGFDTWDKLFAASQAELEAVPGLGPVKSHALWAWMHTDGGEALVRDLLGAGVKVKAKVVGVLTGKSVCFTGSMKRKRGELEGLVVANGGTVKGTVSKGLTFLVMADPASGSTKAKAAQKNGTRCISEEEFLSMVGALCGSTVPSSA